MLPAVSVSNSVTVSADELAVLVARANQAARIRDAARRYLKTGSLTAEMDLRDALKASDRLADSNWCYRP